MQNINLEACKADLQCLDSYNTEHINLVTSKADSQYPDNVLASQAGKPQDIQARVGNV